MSFVFCTDICHYKQVLQFSVSIVFLMKLQVSAKTLVWVFAVHPYSRTWILASAQVCLAY